MQDPTDILHSGRDYGLLILTPILILVALYIYAMLVGGIISCIWKLTGYSEDNDNSSFAFFTVFEIISVLITVILCIYGISKNGTTKTDCIILNAFSETVVDNSQIQSRYDVEVNYKADFDFYKADLSTSWSQGYPSINASKLIGKTTHCYFWKDNPEKVRFDDSPLRIILIETLITTIIGIFCVFASPFCLHVPAVSASNYLRREGYAGLP